ncbi:MAG: hypothetical protein H7336_10630 [Bacteriovorax sp.]|nr:hypothetical protein [Bacteriovorax sp.]
MTIASLFSAELLTFLQKIEDLGFQLCLIGGAPRDYLMDRSFLSRDLDFELRGKWIRELKEFLISTKINFTELPYEIIRVDFEGFDLEFSNPRTEKAILDNKTHHHFRADLDPSLTYAESFKRRDFTMNAIGIELNLKNKTENVVDPYAGVKALMSKTLKEVSSDFFLDSVRFLRLIRFMIKYNFEMAGSIESKLGQFDLSELSVHHFTEEMLKSTKPGIFINAFNNLVAAYQLQVPLNYNFWRTLKFLPDIENKDDLLVDSFLQNASAGHEVAKFFSMPSSRLKDLKSFHESINNIKNASRDDLIEMSKIPLDKISDLSVLKDLKNLEEKKEWRIYSNDALLVSWNDWEKITVDASEIEATPVALRSYIRYHKALKKVFGNA